ncbi:asparagine synthase-related protein [Mucilaginibacter sp. RS28]|uniref:asparagine synthase (glutamine-hydrolyzing) n=1 Tax=Mucilaginibacter straminoryzae TaxID=2932774 RepID=A0A9X1X3X0_9SPHI|nr:asparagine synthase-related protein [Mucilaginibacter straminoryzae]MCJ8209203.1 asparagine synthase-related protein [Mucilaginibacter straminoryzae]
MSGFVGLIASDNRYNASSVLDKCQEEISRCCNDHLGRHQSPLIDLRFGWLKVDDDTDDDIQPFTDDAKVYITGDVRLDNRERLIELMQQKGVAVDNKIPDSHLVLYAFKTWEEGMMKYLAGDFSFAIWNEATETLFCARDHFGLVPFYYANTEHGFLFSNYYRCLKHVPNLFDELRTNVLQDYFFCGRNDSVEHTIYTKLFKLPPAHQISLKKGKLEISRYWSGTQKNTPVEKLTTSAYVARFYDILERSVGDRVRSKHVSCHLSGGMDSSSVTALTAKNHKERYGSAMGLNAYNFTLETNVVESETFYSKIIAEHLGIPLRHYLADQLAGHHAKDDQTWYPEPAGSLATVPDGGMLRDTLQRSRITLTGFGGDPLFGCQDEIWSSRILLNGVFKTVLDWGKFVVIHKRIPRLNVSTKKKKRKLAAKPFFSPPSWIREDFIDEEYLKAKIELAASPQALADGMSTHPFWPYLFEIGHPGFTGMKMKYLHPFFSLELFEFIKIVPPHLLNQKLILRAAMVEELPAVVVHRQKTLAYSFSRIQNLKKSGLLEFLKDKISSAPDFIKGVIDEPALHKEISDSELLKKADTKKIEALANILLWGLYDYRQTAN